MRAIYNILRRKKNIARIFKIIKGEIRHRPRIFLKSYDKENPLQSSMCWTCMGEFKLYFGKFFIKDKSVNVNAVDMFRVIATNYDIDGYCDGVMTMLHELGHMRSVETGEYCRLSKHNSNGDDYNNLKYFQSEEEMYANMWALEMFLKHPELRGMKL